MKVKPRRTQKRVAEMLTPNLKKIIVLMDDDKATAQFMFKNGKLSKPTKDYWLPF